MKPNINIEHTSSQKFFGNNESNMWDNDNAPILVGIGIRNPENIGGLIRLAGTIGCKKVIFADNETEHKLAKIKKTATTAFNKVEWEFTELNNWKTLIPNDYKIIALETTSDSKSIYKSELDNKIAFVVGDERYGIDIESLKLCDKKMFIPMVGSVKSLNVVQAASIALYEYLRRNL